MEAMVGLADSPPGEVGEVLAQVRELGQDLLDRAVRHLAPEPRTPPLITHSIDSSARESMRSPVAQRRAFAVWAGLALLAFAIALYARTLRYEFVNWDDPYYVIDNSWIRGLSLDHLRAIFTRRVEGGILPVHLLSYAFDHALWGLDPFGYHLHSVLLNAANGVLAFWVIARLTSRWDVALIAAALFTVHPSHVEAVAWISSRKDLLFTAFLLLSTAAYARARRDAVLNRPAYAASIALFGLGLLSKATISAFVLFFLLLDVALDARLPAERRRTTAFHLSTKLPYLAMAAVGVYVNTLTQVVDPLSAQPLDYLLVKGDAGWRYGGLLLGVLRSQPIYDVPPISFQPLVAAMTLAPLFAAPLLIALALRRGYTNVALALGWIVAGLLPPIAFPLISFIAERYLYAPSLGFCWLLALGIARISDGMRSPARRSAALAVFTAVSALWFAQHTWLYTPTWRNSEAMWSYAMQHSRYGIAAVGLVTTLRWSGRLDEALRVADQELAAIENGPATPQIASKLHAARGAVLWDLGRSGEAIAEWQRALAIDPENATARTMLDQAHGRS